MVKDVILKLVEGINVMAEEMDKIVPTIFRNPLVETINAFNKWIFYSGNNLLADVLQKPGFANRPILPKLATTVPISLKFSCTEKYSPPQDLPGRQRSP